jgi:nucleotide-binding universal stress UspA family protein
MKTIIIPTDFSPVATNAMHYAVDMAQAVNASILLLHVYQASVIVGEIPVNLADVEEVRKSSEQQLEELKAGIERQLTNKVKVYAEARLGDVTDELEELCSKIDPFAVVMGTKGAGLLERIFIGSNTLTTIRRLKHPVIVVPPGAVFGGIKKIGFACELRKVVETTPAAVIKKMADAFGASIHILNVDYENKHFEAGTPAEALLLNNLLHPLEPAWHFIEDPDVEHGVNDFAEKNNIDLLVVIPRKHKLLEGLFQKSHSRELIFHSHVPIMAMHE